jgi:hypothetical protein
MHIRTATTSCVTCHSNLVQTAVLKPHMYAQGTFLYKLWFMIGGKLSVQEILQAQEHILIHGSNNKNELLLFSYLCDNQFKKGGTFSVTMLLFNH